MALLAFAYELVKETVNPGITNWESHSVTIGFFAVVSFVAGFVVFGQHSRKNAELNRHRSTLEKVVEQRTAKLNQANEELQHQITERTAIEARMIQSQKMEALGTLAGGIAHDFNNILAAILGNTQLLMRLEKEGSPHHEFLEDISTSCMRATNLIRQIMTFSRMDTASLVVLDLSQLVEESLRMLRATLPANIVITKVMSSEPLMVRADATQIQQIVINLCTNGFQAMKAGGTLQLVTEPVHARLGIDPEAQPVECVRLSVTDTGSGIEASILGRIFDPFFTTKAVNEGTGLGLAVAHGIMESHSGKIVAESEVGAGTTFSVFLPRVEELTAEKLPTGPIQLSRGVGRLLVVEDEPQLRSLYQRALAEQGYSVQLCNNGEEALAVLRENPEAFDLVLTDHEMPSMTGRQLIPEVRKLRPDLPIILATGFDMSEEKGGLEHYRQLLKPVDNHLLLTSVAELLNG